MVSPPIQVFLTTIASQPALRQRQGVSDTLRHLTVTNSLITSSVEYILRILQAKKITFNSYDLASDEDAKRLWRRKAPLDKQQLPGILVGGTCPGSFADFEEAVEYNELGTFLRLNESWDESIEETRPTLPTKPIGVPGAASPSQMASPAHRALFNASPREPAASTSSPAAKESLRKRDKSEFDVGEELSGYGLQGVKVTDEDLLALVEELGLGAEEAGDLVKGLSDSTDKADKGGEATEVRGRDDGGSGDRELPGARSAAEAAPEAVVPVAHEEAKAAEGDNVGKTETEVADSAGT